MNELTFNGAKVHARQFSDIINIMKSLNSFDRKLTQKKNYEVCTHTKQ